MAELRKHLNYLEDELAAAEAAPLSRRRALLVALLADAFADRLFAAGMDGGDVLEWRAKLAGECAALGAVFAVARGDGSADLRLEAVTVAPADHDALGVEDFMVSLYNGHTVQRVILAASGGDCREAHPVLVEAVGFLASRMPENE